MLPLLLALQAAVPSQAPLPQRIANPGFERGLRHWTARGHRGFRAGAMRIVDYSSDRPAEGRGWLRAGWAARSGAPFDAAYHVTTLVDARRYRGRRVRLTAMTRAPEFAHRTSALIIEAGGRAAELRIAASTTWQPHSVILDVPRDARVVELGFRLEDSAGELEADDVRLAILR